MTPAAIRRLVAGDLVAYKGLRDETLLAFPEAFTSDAEPERAAASYLSRVDMGLRGGGAFTLGAWHGRRLVGAVTCERDARAKVRHIGHLIGMMVRADTQGHGVGRMLLEACIGEARRTDGLVLLTLNVTTGNAAAVHLYERAGFVRYARLPHAIKVGGVYFGKDQMSLTL
jgi:ribosomal protein S18 acetylase RimI-like enzyme